MGVEIFVYTNRVVIYVVLLSGLVFIGRIFDESALAMFILIIVMVAFVFWVNYIRRKIEGKL